MALYKTELKNRSFAVIIKGYVETDHFKVGDPVLIDAIQTTGKVFAAQVLSCKDPCIGILIRLEHLRLL